jgi:GAF domain-containing protein
MRRRRAEDIEPAPVEETAPESKTRLIDAIPIPVGDPIETVLLSSGGPVVLRDLELESPTLDGLRDSGVELVVPLIGQGELLGALYLGPRLSDQP